MTLLQVFCGGLAPSLEIMGLYLERPLGITNSKSLGQEGLKGSRGHRLIGLCFECGTSRTNGGLGWLPVNWVCPSLSNLLILNFQEKWEHLERRITGFTFSHPNGLYLLVKLNYLLKGVRCVVLDLHGINALTIGLGKSIFFSKIRLFFLSLIFYCIFWVAFRSVLGVWCWFIFYFGGENAVPARILESRTGRNV